MFNKKSYIYIAGHTGLLGSAILQQLQKQGFENIITRSHKELDLANQIEVEDFFRHNKIEYIFLCAAKVGGIIGNKTYPATYLHQNIAIQDNIFQMSVKYGVKHVLFYGSSCTYPKQCQQPMKEEYWLNGKRSITLWGSGKPRREFIYSGDVASASIFLMQNTHKLKNQFYNLGTGVDYSIKELAQAIAKVVGFDGKILWDETKPDGTPQKLLDSNKFLELGWRPKVTFQEGLQRTYQWYKEHYE